MAHEYEGGRIEPEIVIEACRWGVRWVDAFRRLVEPSPPHSRDSVSEAIKQAFESSLASSPAVRRYTVSGMPVLRAIIVAEDVFCIAFEGEADLARELIGQAFSAQHL